MLRIKKLDIFVLKSFLLLFAGTFFICLFIFMMQFLWRYVDELVGKGLEINVLAQFFFYSGLTLIPLSLPLAILLAALMTFGNFGERYELLSMKAAGIPLLRIIRPVVLFCVFLGGMSFFFQNIIGPRAQKQLWTLLVSMKQKSPEVDIPEGVFYSDIDGYNIYVKHKDRKTGLLKDILIYNFSDGFENAHIIWAAEGKLELTADKQHLFLHLYNGEQFENLKSQSVISRNVPYRRETFKEKHTLIQFSSEFNMVDGSFLDRRSDIKNMHEISVAIDSLTTHADSVGRSMYSDIMSTTYRGAVLTPADSVKMKTENIAVINTDSIYNSMTSQLKVLTTTENRVKSLSTDWDMKSFLTKDTDNSIRSHRSDWHKKITLSLACIIFFFIGAPLGAIIRKEETRRYVVPSAPGKRHSGDTKVTDLLYKCYGQAILDDDREEDFEEILKVIKDRYDSIINGLELTISLDDEFKTIQENFSKKIGRDYAASRGEYLNGIIMAVYLGYEFIDAAEVIFFDEEGEFDAEKTNEVLSERLAHTERAVIPGF